MPSNSEMYERGALDAEHDELNPFYYQHYYYYRRGYDTTRRRLRSSGRSITPLLLLALALAIAAGGALWWAASRGGAPAEAQPAPLAPTVAPAITPSITPTVAPTASPIRPTAPALGAGARARVVNLSGSPLRAREAPSLEAAVVGRIPEGAEVTLLAGPVEADGYTWWQVEVDAASGWVAGSSAEGAAYLEVVP